MGPFFAWRRNFCFQEKLKEIFPFEAKISFLELTLFSLTNAFHVLFFTCCGWVTIQYVQNILLYLFTLPFLNFCFAFNERKFRGPLYSAALPRTQRGYEVGKRLNRNLRMGGGHTAGEGGVCPHFSCLGGGGGRGE